MTNSYNKNSSKTIQSIANSFTDKTQNKAKELQDNRPTSILQRKLNKTGLPDNLKSGIENLSGHSIDDVKVHYNSSQPAQLNAHAYAQGTDIHIASGQEKHLPHEAWHIVQQKQGRVKPTLQLKSNLNLNDDKGLENEADVMGAKASVLGVQELKESNNTFSEVKSKTSSIVQKKNRIDTSKMTAERAPVVNKQIETYKEERREAKRQETANWVNNPNGNGDETYNTNITNIRKEYELKVLALHKNLPQEEKLNSLISGPAYYGENLPGTNVYKRPDNQKQYIKDHRGTFIPRYVRRELNRNDIPDGPIPTTGINTYSGLLNSGKIHDIEGVLNPNASLTFDHREFIQQSRGGGNNKFAISHTSTKRPILSNAHDSFGTHRNGAILTDLSKLHQEQIRAQWENSDEDTGHKEMLHEGRHKQLGSQPGFQNRDSTVRMSGLRNMEIVTGTVPSVAIVRKPSHQSGDWSGKDWNGNYEEPATDREIREELRKKKLGVKKHYNRIGIELDQKFENKNKERAIASYSNGESSRGLAMITARRELEK
jgi:hypothetical protein